MLVKNPYDNLKNLILSRLTRIYSKFGKNITIGQANKYGLRNEIKYIDNILDKLIEGTIRDLEKSFLNSQKAIYSDILELFNVNANTPLSKFNMEINFPWSGLTFDKRLRGVGAKLKSDLIKEITQGIRKRNTLEELLVRVDKTFEKYMKRIEVIQRVETEHFINIASIYAYKKLKIKRVIWYARIDERTCPVCGDLHEQEFSVDQIPMIPQHPNCRCRIVPKPD